MLTAKTFRRLRILILLLILLVVSLNTWLSRIRTTNWQDTLWVVIYPINGDGRADTQTYINGLTSLQYAGIEAFFVRETVRYGVSVVEPILVQLAPQVHAAIPQLSKNPSLFETIRWSLWMRWWAWRNDSWEGPPPDIQIFVRYHSPQHSDNLAHSLGLQKGLIGLVNAFASERYEGQNNMVTTHELLHTLGATDKYVPQTGFPLWPEGFAEPDRVPRFPQRLAEIMAGRLPVSQVQAVIPLSLEGVVVGPLTADEINWR